MDGNGWVAFGESRWFLNVSAQGGAGLLFDIGMEYRRIGVREGSYEQYGFRAIPVGFFLRPGR